MGEAKRRRATGATGAAGAAGAADGDCLPMSAEELNRAMAVADAAMDTTSGPDLSAYRVPLELAFPAKALGLPVTEDPTEAARRDIQTVAMTNTPSNRTAHAVYKLTGGGRRFTSTMSRIRATLRRLHDEEAQRWIRTSTGSLTPREVHRAVMEVAGAMTLKMAEDFDRQAFWQAVEERAGGDEK